MNVNMGVIGQDYANLLRDVNYNRMLLAASICAWAGIIIHLCIV